MTTGNMKDCELLFFRRSAFSIQNSDENLLNTQSSCRPEICK